MCDPTAMSLDEYIEMNQIRPRFRRPWNGANRSRGGTGDGREGNRWGRDRPRNYNNQWQNHDEEDDDEEDEDETEQRWGGRRNFRRRDNWQQDNERNNWRPRNRRPNREDDSSSEVLDIQQEGAGKLYVSNLHPEILINDLKELFAAIGPVKTVNVHYDRLGRSLGTADVIYEKRAEAVKAMREYNGVPLDGKQIRVSLLRDCGELRVPKLGLQRRDALRRYVRER